MGIGTVFVLSFITALSGAMMPGPLLTVTIAQTAKRGFLASVLLILGHALLEFLLVLGLVLGLGRFLKIPPVIGSVTVLGGAMLLWMGWGMIRDARQGVLDINTESSGNEAAGKRSILHNPIIAGAVVSLSNPYWIIWWATIGLTFFAALSQNALVIVGAFYLGHIAGDMAWYLAVGAAVATGRRVIKPSVYRVIVQICGGFLLFLGCSFLYLVATGKLWAIKMSMDWMKK